MSVKGALAIDSKSPLNVQLTGKARDMKVISSCLITGNKIKITSTLQSQCLKHHRSISKLGAKEMLFHKLTSLCFVLLHVKRHVHYLHESS